MARCKHMNARIIERGDWYSTWYVEDGQISDEAVQNEGSYQNTVLVDCEDCGMKRWYSKYSCPKWLHKHLIQAGVLLEDVEE